MNPGPTDACVVIGEFVWLDEVLRSKLEFHCPNILAPGVSCNRDVEQLGGVGYVDVNFVCCDCGEWDAESGVNSVVSACAEMLKEGSCAWLANTSHTIHNDRHCCVISLLSNETGSRLVR